MSSTAAVSEPVVEVSHGALRGSRREHGYLFGAVPFAAPPVGERRYRRPEPPQPWQGMRDATAAAGTMPQARRTLPGLRSESLLGTWDGSDPGLCVNVWTPEPGGGPLPVLVWLHGGAFVAGSPAQPLYDGRAWMRDGVVLVTVSYRLGVEGFTLFAGGEANVALHDQLAALRWVRDEIAAFGGDPERVCVCGQSAGAMSLGHLLGAPAAGGLFQRAISMSGGLSLTLSVPQAERVAAVVAARAGAEPSAEAMRAVPIANVIEAQAAITPADLDLGGEGEPAPGGGLIWVMPVRDGELVAEDPLAALGGAGAVELLAGDTSEEGRLYLAGVPGFDELGEDALMGIAAGVTTDPQALIAGLRAEHPDAAPGDLAAAAIGEVAFHRPTRELLERHANLGGGATHAYRFTWRSGALGGRLGAAHAVDLPFVFDVLDTPGAAGADDAMLGVEGGPPELARAMHGAWVRFVHGEGPGWDPYPYRQTF